MRSFSFGELYICIMSACGWMATVGNILVARDALADAMDCLASEEVGEGAGGGEDGRVSTRETRRLRSDATDSIPVDYCYTSPRTFLVVEPWDLRCRKDESQEVSDG